MSMRLRVGGAFGATQARQGDGSAALVFNIKPCMGMRSRYATLNRSSLRSGPSWPSPPDGGSQIRHFSTLNIVTGAMLGFDKVQQRQNVAQGLFLNPNQLIRQSIIGNVMRQHSDL